MLHEIQKFSTIQKNRLRTTNFDSINLNRVLVLEDSQTNYKSYSVVINDDSNLYFENFHVIEQDEIPVESFIYRWLPDDPNIPFDSKTFSGKLQKFNLEYQLQAESTLLNGEIQTERVAIYCVFLSLCTCSGDPYYCGCTESSCPTIFANYCYTGGGSDSGNDSNFGDGLGGESGGGSDNNSNSENDVLIGENGDPLHPVVPLPEMEEEPYNLNPCNELKKLTKNPIYEPNPYMDNNDKRIRTAIINMPDEITSSAEAGYTFIQPSPANQLQGPYANYVQPNAATNHIYFELHPLIYGYIHSHPNDGKHVPMFSHDDIYTLLEIAENFNLYAPAGINTSGNDFFTVIMTSEIRGVPNTYAIKINNISKLQKLKTLHPKENGTNKKWRTFGEKMEKYYEKSANGNNGNQTQYEKTLLQFLQDEDLGVSLYQMEQINTGTSNVQEIWKKIELDGNNPPKKTPCN